MEPNLDRDAILKTNDVRPVKVDVPEWGGHIYVRAMSGLDRDRFEQMIFVGKGEDRRLNDNYRARLVCLTACDANGVRIFREDDVPALGAKSAAALDRVVEAAAQLNGIGEKAVTDAKKPSGEGQSAGSISA